ncbi:unnamed protein product [Danaus chrysippus]|uniref:(African queen) hypothetical protein n=1 Tax=Danaus chrysippus TaxID=151541 RepID=A0A8J2W5X8_9NEOP|nr:unnamed protein product [Danaus chrysippus]
MERCTGRWDVGPRRASLNHWVQPCRRGGPIAISLSAARASPRLIYYANACLTLRPCQQRACAIKAGAHDRPVGRSGRLFCGQLAPFGPARVLRSGTGTSRSGRLTRVTRVTRLTRLTRRSSVYRACPTRTVVRSVR